MDNKNTKDLTVVKKTVFDKIKYFFKKLFSKDKKEKTKEEKANVETVEETGDTKDTNKENSFINDIKIEENQEEKRLIKLQALIAEGIITEDELPEEDIKELHILYDKQILDLKKSIDEYKEKILKIRMNINE